MTEKEYMYTFGKVLNRIMRSDEYSREPLTQKELAKRSGVTECAISLYIQGKRMPNIYNLTRIARVLNCTIHELTYLDDNTYKWAVDAYGPMKHI